MWVNLRSKQHHVLSKIILAFFIFISEESLAQDLSQLLDQLNQAKSYEEKISGLKKVGAYYQKVTAYNKAIDYFQKAAKLEKQDNTYTNQYHQTIENIAFCYLQLEQFTQAIAQYEKLLLYYKNQSDIENTLSTLNQIIYLYKQVDKPQQAIKYAQESLDLSNKIGNYAGIVNASNNLGFLYKQSGDKEQALKLYQQALRFNKQANMKNSKIVDEAIILTNTGVVYTQLGNFSAANTSFKQALDLWEKKNQPLQIARTYNYLAANQYINRKHQQAINNALKAVEIAKIQNNEEILLVSYQILTEAYQEMGEFKTSQKYLRLQQLLKEKLKQEQIDRQQKILEEQIKLEKKENELKSLLSEKEKQSLALKQSELERQKQEQDLKLKEQELAILKNNQEKQAILLKNQQLGKRKSTTIISLCRTKESY